MRRDIRHFDLQSPITDVCKNQEGHLQIQSRVIYIYSMLLLDYCVSSYCLPAAILLGLDEGYPFKQLHYSYIIIFESTDLSIEVHIALL